MVLSKLKRHLNAKNTLREHGSIHRHRNLNYTERSAIARHRNFNAPKICKITVHRCKRQTQKKKSKEAFLSDTFYSEFHSQFFTYPTVIFTHLQWQKDTPFVRYLKFHAKNNHQTNKRLVHLMIALCMNLQETKNKKVCLFASVTSCFALLLGNFRGKITLTSLQLYSAMTFQ